MTARADRTLAWFLTLARAEGVSAIALFAVAMPLKYGAGIPHATLWAGWLHGALFLTYLVALWSTARVQGWTWTDRALGFAAAIVPAGTFWFERRVR